ncbi:MAG: LamG domain-containing protein [Saprospiraceae bacterium]
MKKKHLYNTIFLLIITITVANAQYDGIIKYWTFDATTEISGQASPSKDHFSLFKTSESIAFSSGIDGQAVSLVDKNYWIEFNKIPDLEDDFSVSFWFNVLDINGVQSLLLQNKMKENGEVSRYLQLKIDNGKLIIKNEKTQQFAINNPTIQSNFWYQITYVYDGFELQLYLDKALIYKSTETSIFTNLPCCNDKLFIGKPANSAKGLKGYVDEIMIFEEAIETEMVEKINLIMNMKPPKVEVDTPITFVAQPIEKIVDKKNELAKITAKRLNEIQETITVTTTDIEFEIWDYDEYDKDKVYFILNESLPFYTNTFLNKKRKSVKYRLPTTLQFKENDDNFLIFVAEDMGNFPSQNTAAVRLWLDGKAQSKIYKFVLTEDKNAVLKITHSKEIMEEKPIVNIEKPIDKTTFPNTQPDNPEPEITVNKVATNKHELTVSDTILTISIMDNSVVDGDSVTILHNGKVVIANYGLTDRLHTIPVQLIKNQANNFTFVPVSMGSKNTQNTALVIIEADGKTIDKVTLSSLDKNRPAKLVIVHKTKE